MTKSLKNDQGTQIINITTYILHIKYGTNKKNALQISTFSLNQNQLSG